MRAIASAEAKTLTKLISPGRRVAGGADSFYVRNYDFPLPNLSQINRIFGGFLAAAKEPRPNSGIGAGRKYARADAEGKSAYSRPKATVSHPILFAPLMRAEGLQNPNVDGESAQVDLAPQAAS